MPWKRSSRGSITIETAIVLPVFICVVISLAMLIRLVYIHDVMQHVIDETANELASYSYIYHISDLQMIDESIQAELGENSKQAEAHMEAMMDAFSVMEEAYSTGSTIIKETKDSISSEASFYSKAEVIIHEASKWIGSGKQLSQQGLDGMEQLQKVLEEACKDPEKEVKSIAWMLSKSVYSDAKNAIAVPLVKFLFRKNLEKGEWEDVEAVIKRLNIYNGFQGMDFYSSTFFDGNENIDIIVKYKVELPLPIKILPDIYMVQRSTARAWLNGGDGALLQQENIWDLPNKQRGIKIEELYGGNLPYDFPKIDIYDAASNSGTSIKSINLNSKSYLDAANLNKRLREYVDAIKLSQSITYKGQVYEINVRKLIIVIPKNSLNDINRPVLKDVMSYAEGSGVRLTISEL